MANRVVSIEIGYTTTQLIETDYKVKNPRVYRNIIIPTPEGVIEDGYINGEIEFSQVLKQTLSHYKFKAKQAVCTVTSSKIATREVLLPPVKNNQVQPMVEANAGDYFPINLSEYELGHLVLGNVKEGEAYKLKVLVMACPKTLIEGYSRLCSMAGLHLLSIDYSGNSIYQVMKNEITEDTEMIIRVDEKSSIATIISGASMVMQRNVMYGIENAVYTMMNSLAFPQKTFEDAFAEFVRNECINLTLNPDTPASKPADTSDTPNDADSAMARLGRLNGVVSASGMSAGGTYTDPSSPIGAAKREITDSLAPLIGNVSRVLDLYNSKNEDKPIKKVTLIGMGSAVKGLDKLFENELGIPTAPLGNFRPIAAKDSPAILISAYGAALAPIGFVSEEKKKAESKAQVNYIGLSIILGVACLVAAAVLCIVPYSRYLEQVNKEKMLKNQEQEYIRGEEVQAEAQSLGDLCFQISAAASQTGGPNDALIEFLEKLEEVLPVLAQVDEFQSNADAANVTICVMDLETAAKVIDTVRTFDCARDVKVMGIQEVEFTPEEYRDYVIKQGYLTAEEYDAYTEEKEKKAAEEGEDAEEDEGNDTLFILEDGTVVYVPDKYYKYTFTVVYRTVIDDVLDKIDQLQEGDS